MPASTVVTVRIEKQLLAALRQRAAREETSVSAQIVRLVRESVAPQIETAAPRRPRATSGMFADYEAPDLRELTALRRRFSAELLASAASEPAPPARGRERKRPARRRRA